MDELTLIFQMKDLPLGGSTTCRLESLKPVVVPPPCTQIESHLYAQDDKQILKDFIPYPARFTGI